MRISKGKTILPASAGELTRLGQLVHPQNWVSLSTASKMPTVIALSAPGDDCLD